MVNMIVGVTYIQPPSEGYEKIYKYNYRNKGGGSIAMIARKEIYQMILLNQLLRPSFYKNYMVSLNRSRKDKSTAKKALPMKTPRARNAEKSGSKEPEKVETPTKFVYLTTIGSKEKNP
jgi:hypothetical protein